jgi:16S rRNA A1518/A1519 N6-dimethyltransferase RsmA/KsgA/DIM1 with predicted DNA glycosylase/AP lyase activity
MLNKGSKNTKIINDKLGVDKIVIMVQKEVGDRFNKPNSKEYNALTILLALLSDTSYSDESHHAITAIFFIIH